MDAQTALDHLIGNLYFNFGALPTIAAKLHPDDLPDSPGKTIYREMCRLYMSPDAKLSAGALESALRAINFDFRYLGDLQTRVLPESIEALEEYADVINNAADLQQLRREMASLEQMMGEEGADTETLIPEFMRRLTNVNRRGGNTLVPLADVMDTVIADLQKWSKGEVTQGLATGFKDIDDIIRLNPGDLILLAARPSMGKTALAMAIAENVAIANPDAYVVVFSAEMTKESLGHRMASAYAGVNSHRLRNGTADPDEYAQAIDAARKLQRLPIMIDETSGITTEQMYYRCAMLSAQHPISLVMFDFVELGADKPSRGSDSEEQRISIIARGLKAIAKNLKVPVLALSQLSRKVEERSDKLPQLADLRYSGMLEQVSDVVMFIMRPEYYITRNERCYLDEAFGDPSKPKTHPHSQNVAYILVAKHRNGPIGRVNLLYMAKYTRFRDLVRQERGA